MKKHFFPLILLASMGLILIVTAAVQASPYAALSPTAPVFNFSLQIVDPQGNRMIDVPMLIYKSGRPDDVACRGYCTKHKILEPGSYDILIEKGLLIQNIQVKSTGKTEKIIEYDRGDAKDWNLQIRVLNEDGWPSDDIYKVSRSDSPSDILCYCSTLKVPRLHVPAGTYDIMPIYTKAAPLKGVVIKEGDKLIKDFIYQSKDDTKTPPQNLRVETRQSVLVIQWDNPVSKDLRYVEVYRSTAPDEQGGLLIQTTHARVNRVIDGWAEPGKSLYYWARARYQDRQFSPFSGPASVKSFKTQ